jgi:hypothetical protein
LSTLQDFLDERSEIEWVSSTLLEIETYRALIRATGPADMPAVINQCSLTASAMVSQAGFTVFG